MGRRVTVIFTLLMAVWDWFRGRRLEGLRRDEYERQLEQDWKERSKK